MRAVSFAGLFAGLLLGCGHKRIPPDGPAHVDVVEVSVTGDDGAYTVYVTLRSDETGCDQYADFWELLTPEGALVYRRILDHSHPNEQPFTRSGGPVDVLGTDEIIVRGHLHPHGYGGDVLRGSLGAGFSLWTPPEGFAADLEAAPPQPEACLF